MSTSSADSTTADTTKPIDPLPQTNLRPQRRLLALRWISIAVIIVSIFVIISRLVPIQTATAVLDSWIKDLGIWGPVVFGAIYIIAALFLIPGSAMTLAAGPMFGLVYGTITVSIASTAAAAFAFLIGRYGARD